MEVGPGVAERTITNGEKRRREPTQTTARETIVIYSAPGRWPEARRYGLFEIIDVPGNFSGS